jgi:lipoyl-dependent peroxiredoxin
METTAEVTLEKVADGFAITAVHLTLKGKVPGADQAKFEELAGKAKAGCPVSKVLKRKDHLGRDAGGLIRGRNLHRAAPKP